jgi:isoleucyl-tRNA synthetase
MILKHVIQNYMESVWWAFNELWNKGLIYQGYKIMPYSTGCETELSNSEASLDYREVSDLSVIVKFKQMMYLY